MLNFWIFKFLFVENTTLFDIKSPFIKVHNIPSIENYNRNYFRYTRRANYRDQIWHVCNALYFVFLLFSKFIILSFREGVKNNICVQYQAVGRNVTVQHKWHIIDSSATLVEHNTHIRCNYVPRKKYVFSYNSQIRTRAFETLPFCIFTLNYSQPYVGIFYDFLS